MERQERLILAELGISDPYAEAGPDTCDGALLEAGA
jgi:hypothetical protein